ncbi:hypothetical protein BDW22DRAFT_1427914 [Trametopsis cervina]|nr:hypothetical protein BDW22DRAFT_1427914 [Trametopsis cervina]
MPSFEAWKTEGGSFVELNRHMLNIRVAPEELKEMGPHFEELQDRYSKDKPGM